MSILYRYLFGQIFVTTVVAVIVLTAVIVLGNVFQRVFDLIVNNDIPIHLVFYMVSLLVPQALTLTIPWGLLIAVLLVFGRMSQSNELIAIRSAGLGLIPFIAPVVLLSIFMSLVCFVNNSELAPYALKQFKLQIVSLAKENPTVFLKANEPITQFEGFRLFIGRKSANTVEDVFIWEMGENNIPKRSIRADRGVINADLENEVINITLYNARQEERGEDVTQLEMIQTGIRAAQLPLNISLSPFLDTSHITEKPSNMVLGDLVGKITTTTQNNFMPLLTEVQKRLSISFAAFTFVLVGVPLAITAQRSETSVGVVISLGIAVLYYFLIIVADAMKEKIGAYPEIIVWLPNVIFQALGIWLLYRVNKSPA